MSAPAYTVRIHADYNTAGYRYSLPVPAGYIQVVRCIDIQGEPLSGGDVTIFIDGLGPIFRGFLNEHVGSGYMGWRGRQVLEAGERLSIYAANPASVTISGYLLSSS